MSEGNNIYKSITAAMNKINAISKDRTNQKQGFKYRGVDDVMNELHGVFADCEIFAVPKVTHEERGTYRTQAGAEWNTARLTVDVAFYAADGSSVVATVIGEGNDSADKASNKALSVAFKYACLQVFCIPTEDDKDPDETTPPPPQGSAPKNAQPKAKGTAQQQTPDPLLVEEMKRLHGMKLPNGQPIFVTAESWSRWQEMAKQVPLAQVVANCKTFVHNAVAAAGGQTQQPACGFDIF